MDSCHTPTTLVASQLTPVLEEDLQQLPVQPLNNTVSSKPMYSTISDVFVSIVTAASVLSVSVSSSANIVLDISGYNSFTLQCDASFSSHFIRANESFDFVWKRNDKPLNIGVLINSLTYSASGVYQNSSVQQTALSGTSTLEYNCSVLFSIRGSLITTSSSITYVTVKGKLELSDADYTKIHSS